MSNSFVSLGRVAGPLLAGLLFDRNPNFPYFAGALILSIVFIMSLIWVMEAGPGLQIKQAV
jgi:DHA1 family multidrug resistance protein-like MFS transporter